MIDDCIAEAYKNELDIRGFSQLLNDNAQGYKYYWLEAIVDLSCIYDGDIPFEDIFDHMILNTFATKMIYFGMNVKALQDILGHQEFSTTMDIYVDRSQTLMREELEKIEQLNMMDANYFAFDFKDFKPE